MSNRFVLRWISGGPGGMGRDALLSTPSCFHSNKFLSGYSSGWTGDGLTESCSGRKLPNRISSKCPVAKNQTLF